VPVYVSGAVEGPSDEAVLHRLVASRGAVLHRVQVQNGKANLRRALPGYNADAARAPWLVLVDLDQQFDCAAACVADWLPEPKEFMRFRVVVRSIESWLLADCERFAMFFSVNARAIPNEPDSLPDPKQAFLSLIAKSHKRAIRDDILPRPRSGRRVGPAYTSRLIEFATNEAAGWRPETAAERSPSLARCLKRFDQLLAVAPR
jgi:hypothetical protein